MSNVPVKKRAFKGLRINVLAGSIFFGLFCVVLKLFQIQVLSHKKYESMGQSQYWSTKALTPTRGSIFSADGYLLAGNTPTFLMYGEPKVIKDKGKTAFDIAELVASFDASETSDSKALAVVSSPGNQEILEISLLDHYKDEFLSALEMDLYWVPLRKNLTQSQVDRIKELKIEGVGFEESFQRYYPDNKLASHVLGYVGSDDAGQKKGYYGVEGFFDEDLKGRPGRVMEETDATGSPILAGNFRKQNSLSGRDIYLTLDRSIQYKIEKMVKDGVEEYDARSGTVIIMDPYTGSVLAMANYPNYDPLRYYADEYFDSDVGERYRKDNEVRNLAIQQLYEPGSIMKPLTVAAALDLGLITPDSTFNDEGPVYYSGYKVDNWNFKHLGVQTITQLLEKSNNIGAAWVGHKVGSENLTKYFKSFGIGEKTGIELQGEDTSYVRRPDDITDVDLANMSFGQGISVTPLQILSAFNVFANGGLLYKPTIVAKVDDGKKVLEVKPKMIRRVISEETAAKMVSMLENAAAKGEASYFISKSYKLAGKTGTAEIYENGKYTSDKSNASFVGFLSGSKRISLIVKLEEPRTSTFASLTAAPLWTKIMDELVKFYDIVPDNIDSSAVVSN